eukprot:7459975-Karenia_brevis.AAC.1
MTAPNVLQCGQKLHQQGMWTGHEVTLKQAYQFFSSFVLVSVDTTLPNIRCSSVLACKRFQSPAMSFIQQYEYGQDIVGQLRFAYARRGRPITCPARVAPLDSEEEARDDPYM